MADFIMPSEATQESAVTISQQTLTAEQQTQIRTNIGAASSSTVRSLSEKVDAVRTFYGTCETAADEQNKIVICSNFPTTNSDVKEGFKLVVKFTYGQTYSSANIRIQIKTTSEGSIVFNKYAYRRGTVYLSVGEWDAGAVLEFTYDGNGWIITGVGGSIATTSCWGRTKLTSAVDSTSETLAATAKAVSTLNADISSLTTNVNTRVKILSDLTYFSNSGQTRTLTTANNTRFIILGFASTGAYSFMYMCRCGSGDDISVLKLGDTAAEVSRSGSTVTLTSGRTGTCNLFVLPIFGSVSIPTT